jgi:Ca-activated chloride channel family protein
MDFAVWRFAQGWLLVAVVLLGPVVYAALRGLGQGKVQFPDVGLVQGARGGRHASFRLAPIALRVAALFLLILALARPQGGSVSREVTSDGVDILLVADASGSMRALDLFIGDERAPRLEVAKKVIRDFVDGRVGDRIGLVVFGDEAIVQCPTTVDYGVLEQTLAAVKIGMAGGSTAIGSAIGTATNSLMPLPGHSKVIILLTDGKNETGLLDPVQAARAAATYGIKIYTIGVGSRGDAPVPVQGLLGGTHYRYVPVDLDEPTLQAIADATGGRYYRADSTETLEKVFKIIDELERTEVEVKEFTDYEELYTAALWPALLLLLLELVLRATWLRTLP